MATIQQNRDRLLSLAFSQVELDFLRNCERFNAAVEQIEFAEDFEAACTVGEILLEAAFPFGVSLGERVAGSSEWSFDRLM